MEAKYKQSLIFWGVMFLLLLAVPFTIAITTTNGLITYLRIILSIIFGPLIPLYIFFRIYSYIKLFKQNKISKTGLFYAGNITLFLVGAIWLMLIIYSYIGPTDAGSVLGFAIFPILIVGAIGEKCAKSSINT